LRAVTPFPKIVANLVAPDGSTEKIELLADGQQFVAAGIHPDTGQPYRWNGGELGEIRHDELPCITEAEARALVGALVALLLREHGYTAKESKSKDDEQAGSGSAEWSGFLADPADHDKLAAFAMSLIAAGMRADAAINLLRAAVDGEDGDPERKQRRHDEIPGMVSSAQAKHDKQAREIPIEGDEPLFWHGEPDPRPRKKWRIKHLVPAVGAGLLSGQWGTFKTFMGIELATAVIAPGGQFCGRQLAEPCGVLILATEGAFELRDRINASVHEKYPDMARAPISWRESCPVLLANGALEQLTKDHPRGRRRLRGALRVAARAGHHRRARRRRRLRQGRR
jgi:hypothetical protein